MLYPRKVSKVKKKIVVTNVQSSFIDMSAIYVKLLSQIQTNEITIKQYDMTFMTIMANINYMVNFITIILKLKHKYNNLCQLLF